MRDVPDAPHNATTDPVDRDQVLADLLTQLSDRVARGEAVDIHEFSISYPDYSDELRELWVMLLSYRELFVSSGP